MAITFGAVASVSNNSTCTKPTGVVNGSALLAAVLTYDSSSVTITPPSGWTLLTGPATQGSEIRTWQYVKPITNAAGEPANYTFTPSTGVWEDIAILRYEGVDATTPKDATGSTNNGNSATATATAITTATAGAMLVAWFGGYNHGITGDPSGMTERVNGLSGVNHLYDVIQAGAGSTGNKVATKNSDSWTAILDALRPAGAATASLPPTLFRRIWTHRARRVYR